MSEEIETEQAVEPPTRVSEEEVDRLWSAETERRAAELDSGDADLMTWEHVLQPVDERR